MDADDRMCAAVLDLVEEQGLEHVTVASLIARAQVTREEFYWHFSGRLDCFEAALRRAAALERTA